MMKPSTPPNDHGPPLKFHELRDILARLLTRTQPRRVGVEERQTRPRRQDRRDQQGRSQSHRDLRAATATETPRPRPRLLRRPVLALHHYITSRSRYTYELLGKSRRGSDA